MSLFSRSVEQTEELGARIAEHVFAGAFIALHGELGAGKTALARGIGAGLHIADIASPTFTILHEHEGKLPLYHFDAYRLRGEEELYGIGYEEYLSSGGVVLMEWPERVPGSLPRERLDVYMEGSADEMRSILLRPSGQRYEALVQAIYKETEGAASC